MTEQEWSEADADAVQDYWAEHLTPRTLRLFICGCVRRLWHLLTDERNRKAVEVAERLADGLASQQEVESAGETAWEVVDRLGIWTGAGVAAWAALETLGIDTDAEWADPSVLRQHWYMKYAIRALDRAADAAAALSGGADVSQGEYDPTCRHEEYTAYYHLLLDVAGVGSRGSPLDPSWLAWRENTVARIARAIYEERAFDRMPVLADALEEAGCTRQDLLDHLRGVGPHIRGCWALDLLLAKK